MWRRIPVFVLAWVCMGLMAHAARASSVSTITITGVIDPPSSRYLARALEIAAQEGSQCLILQMDTPGGGMVPMREMIQNMMNDSLPVVVYVSPTGARAGSAGTFIAIAADIAAMAPGTNIGAAHPVLAGGAQPDKEMKSKLTNDAAAFIRTIAKKRGRNIQWAESAVRESVSITEEEAVRKKVVDLIAQDMRDLLEKLDGRKAREKVLRTRHAVVRPIPMSGVEKFLHILAVPDLALIFMTLAIYGLIYELANPGAIFPGVIGGISLILGLAFMALALLLFIADIKAPTHGVLTMGGAISFALGAFMLFDNSFVKASISLVFSLTVCTTLFFAFIVAAAVRSLSWKPKTGREGMVGSVAVARTRLAPKGQVFFDGAYWNAISDEVIEEGEQVQVIGIEGLTLRVKRKGLN